MWRHGRHYRPSPWRGRAASGPVRGAALASRDAPQTAVHPRRSPPSCCPHMLIKIANHVRGHVAPHFNNAIGAIAMLGYVDLQQVLLALEIGEPDFFFVCILFLLA